MTKAKTKAAEVAPPSPINFTKAWILRRSDSATDFLDSKKRASLAERRSRKVFATAVDGYVWHGKITDSEYRAGRSFADEYLRAELRLMHLSERAGRFNPESAARALGGSLFFLRKVVGGLSDKNRQILINACVENYIYEGPRQIRALRKALQQLIRLIYCPVELSGQQPSG